MIKDRFSYSARWDSIGLDCAFCKHFSEPESWPDILKISKCLKHKIYLTFELNEDGYKSGEWFCKYFEDNNGAFPEAIIEFNSLKNEFRENIIYGGYGEEGYLKEVKISDQIFFD